MDSVYAASKEKDREKEKEKEKDKDKEKDKEREREMEMEAALYTNCLLLGLDASVLGQNGIPRSGLFRHSNPRMGENLLHFLLSALRGPTQAAKDFAGVWPIFDAGQSRDFRKIVQNLINELEAQGALPRSNSRVSSLATCCGQRFVELLWQLSSHALREVHKRSFPADVSSNPLPPSLTEVVGQSNHASALLTITKARIAIERRRFLDSASTAVHRQALWSSLAHDMTAEYRALCAEEAYLQQELDKLKDSKNQREGLVREWQNGAENSSEEEKSLSVSRASHLWELLISQTALHEKLSSGPIEDLIAHREHRYRVSGPALRAAMERGSSASLKELSSYPAEDAIASLRTDQMNALILKGGHSLSNGESVLSDNASENREESHPRSEERAPKGSAPVDVAEILRRWTHSLQCLHKQALRLARTNDGAGPDLIKETGDDRDNGHTQALRATLADHKQHLSNIQGLIGQLKECMPGMEASIGTLREQLSRTTPLMVSATATSSVSDKIAPLRDYSTGQGAEVVVKTGTRQLEVVSPSPTMKLPQLFSMSSTATGRSLQSQKSHASAHRGRMLESASTDYLVGQTLQNTLKELEGQEEDNLAVLRQAVHEAALSTISRLAEEVKNERSEHAIEHFFTPVVSGSLLSEGLDSTVVSNSLQGPVPRSSQEYHRHNGKPLVETPRGREEQFQSLTESFSPKQAKASKPASKCLSYNGVTKNGTSLSSPEMPLTEAGLESPGGEARRPFSPPLLLELSSFTDTCDNLLGSEDFELSDVALEGVWFNPAM